MVEPAEEGLQLNFLRYFQGRGEGIDTHRSGGGGHPLHFRGNTKNHLPCWTVVGKRSTHRAPSKERSLAPKSKFPCQVSPTCTKKRRKELWKKGRTRLVGYWSHGERKTPPGRGKEATNRPWETPLPEGDAFCRWKMGFRPKREKRPSANVKQPSKGFEREKGNFRRNLPSFPVQPKKEEKIFSFPTGQSSEPLGGRGLPTASRFSPRRMKVKKKL